LEEKHDGLLPPEMQPLKQAEDENVKLREMVKDSNLGEKMVQGTGRAAGNCEACPEAQSG
jgi:hypothetical protein